MSSVVREPRPVVKKFLARPQREGVGATVRRSIGRLELKQFDPFLVLDEFSVTAPAGFPDHPHRGFISISLFGCHDSNTEGWVVGCVTDDIHISVGFETVTYMLQGGVTHEDFEGHKGTIEAGDLQWMSAGRGIVHSEMPAYSEGTQRGLQLWINLSSQYKMMQPRYQEMKSKDIAEAKKEGVKVRVIAGEALGIESPIYTRTPTMFLDFTLKPGAVLRQPIPSSWNAFVYVLEGEAAFGASRSTPVSAHHIVLLGSGDGLEAWNKSTKSVRFVLVGGEPLGEPVVQYGPFVMNTQEEIDQTIEDYENYANGFERARHWKSESTADLGY